MTWALDFFFLCSPNSALFFNKNYFLIFFFFSVSVVCNKYLVGQQGTKFCFRGWRASQAETIKKWVSASQGKEMKMCYCYKGTSWRSFNKLEDMCDATRHSQYTEYIKQSRSWWESGGFGPRTKFPLKPPFLPGVKDKKIISGKVAHLRGSTKIDSW